MTKKEKKASVAIPIVKEFTVAELQQIEIPYFQRWESESNLKDLKESVDQIGTLRCPVICRVEEDGKDYIIDGNHLRKVIINDPLNTKDTKVSCVFKEVATIRDAARAFKLLNTKGKQLDWADITHMYLNIVKDIYEDVWLDFLYNPSNSNELKTNRTPGFTIATIIEFLAGDKNKYRNGLSLSDDIPHYLERKSLLRYLFHNGNKTWDKKFPLDKGKRRPTGAAILGFANYWFGAGHHNSYHNRDFLDLINEIYEEKQKDLSTGYVINRDNAGSLLASKMESVLVEK